ncbi:MAG: oxygenase MpaB family protein [Chloroflexi bacterium]|nr:oxygenase MpaB family protein [Chloroflexota bacterium]
MARRFDIRDRILRLDPKADCQEIVLLVGAYEYPWLIRKSLEFALFRSYGAPSISQLLDKTGQFKRHGQRRVDDTALLLAEIVENGYDSPRGRQAIKMINRMHGKFDIANDDMLYVLSTFVFEPIYWTQRFSWRRPSRQENLANYHFWVEVGARMAIKDIPPTIEEFEGFKQDYERERFRYEASNRRVAEATLQVMQSWYPKPLRPLVRQVVYALLDETLRRAFGYPKALPLVKPAVHGSLLLAAKLLRFLPPRRQPFLLTRADHRSYPDGYQLDKLGPPDVTSG